MSESPLTARVATPLGLVLTAALLATIPIDSSAEEGSAPAQVLGTLDHAYVSSRVAVALASRASDHGFTWPDGVEPLPDAVDPTLWLFGPGDVSMTLPGEGVVSYAMAVAVMAPVRPFIGTTRDPIAFVVRHRWESSWDLVRLGALAEDPLAVNAAGRSAVGALREVVWPMLGAAHKAELKASVNVAVAATRSWWRKDACLDLDVFASDTATDLGFLCRHPETAALYSVWALHLGAITGITVQPLAAELDGRLATTEAANAREARQILAPLLAPGR